MEAASNLLDRTVVRRALAMTDASVNHLLSESSQTRRSGCVVVILEALGGNKVYEENVGKLDEGHDYANIAYRKARKAFETKTNTSLLQTQQPGMFAEGDTHFGGGVYLDGIAAVGISGLEEENDEMIAMWIAVAIKRLLISKMKKFLESGKDFF